MKSLRATQPGTGGILHEEAVQHAHKFHLLRRELCVHRGQHGENGTVLLVCFHAESGERAGDVTPYDGAAFRLVLSQQAGSGKPEQSSKCAADGRRSPGNGRSSAGVVLPTGGSFVLVREEFAKDDPGGRIAFGALLSRDGSNVVRQMFGDDAGAAVGEQELPAEIVPPFLLFPFLNQV